MLFRSGDDSWEVELVCVFHVFFGEASGFGSWLDDVLQDLVGTVARLGIEVADRCDHEADSLRVFWGRDCRWRVLWHDFTVA